MEPRKPRARSFAHELEHPLLLQPPNSGAASKATRRKPQINTTMNSKKTSKSLLAGAALAGILSAGFFGTATAAMNTKSDRATAAAGVLADEKKGETHDCKGHNSCKGKGGCKSGDNGCAGKNSCKGKGGCAMKDGKPAGPK